MFAFSKCNCKQMQVLFGRFIRKENSFSKHMLEELIIHSLKTAYIFHLAIIWSE